MYIEITILIVLLFLSILFINLKYIKGCNKSLNLKHVVITGGSSGIGKSVACEAAKRGAHVTIIARDEEKLNAAINEILQFCKDRNIQKVQSISLDVTNYESVRDTLEKIDSELPVYMLINCAGMAICGIIENISVADIKKLVDLNFLGTLYTIKSLLSFMKKREDGIIVLTASQAALLGIYGMAIYSATKFALRGLAESLYMEVKPYNISVTISLPPDTDTPGFENENKTKPEETQLICESGGLYNPRDIANTLLNDALMGKFYSYNGFESFMLTTLCCGMSPFISILEVCYQALLIGPFRLISSYFILNFADIIKKCKETRA